MRGPNGNSGMLPLRRDPRDDHFTEITFGAPSLPRFPTSLNRARQPVKNQGASLSCTAHAVALASEYQEECEFSAAWQWAQICKALGTYVPNGADPRTAMKTAVTVGSLPDDLARWSFPDDAQKIGNWNTWSYEAYGVAEPYRKAAYIRIPRVGDYFDSVRAALLNGLPKKQVVMAYGTWFYEWSNTYRGIIPSTYVNFAGYHAYAFIDFDTIDGVEYLVAQNSYGTAAGDRGFHLFPREVVNREFAKYGTGLYVFEDLTPEQIALAKQETALGRIQRAILSIWEAIMLKFGAAGGAAEINLWQEIVAALQQILAIRQKQAQDAPPASEPRPEPPPLPVPLSWATVADARHSVRVICDEEGLTLEQKNTLCATIGAESGWQSYHLSGPNKGQPVKLENKDDSGKVWSTDWGICQINDHYHIGPRGPFPSVQYVLDNPEACVRWMARHWKAGRRSWWVAYRNGSYKNFL